MSSQTDEQSPLLRNGSSHQENAKQINFEKDDPEDPHNWSDRRKYVNVAVIALMAIMSPLGSSMFTPAIPQIRESLNTDEITVIGATTGYVVLLGIGPLLLAPLSETFGRRPLYLWCFLIFTLLQIPTALAPNIETLIAVRTLSGFFGSVGIGNGGGTISDMFNKNERAGVFGWYLLGPLMGPTIGPLFGGLIISVAEWPWIFWALFILCAINTALGFFFLKESYAPTILGNRKKQYEQDYGGNYYYEGEDNRPMRQKLTHSIKRPLKILFTQPIVLTMATYQAIIFATNYTLYTTFPNIWGDEYHFSNVQVGLMYLGPGVGFILAVLFIVPRIDTIYKWLASRNDGEGKPEFRLPLASLGAILVPAGLFWLAWAVEFHNHWAVAILSMPFFGLGQVAIFNATQNYFIDAFEQYAASAIAAGALFRSIFGGLVPLFGPPLFSKLGYGWGISAFGFATLALAPSPLLFYFYGEKLRKKFAVTL